DRDAVRREPFTAGFRDVPRSDLREIGFVLSFRSAVLERSARLYFRAGDSGDRRVSAGGARMAIAVHPAGSGARSRRSLIPQAAGRAGIEVPAFCGGVLSAGDRGALLPGSLRDGVE